MKSLLTMWDDLIVKLKAVGRDVETEEMKFMGEIKDRLHAVEYELDVVQIKARQLFSEAVLEAERRIVARLPGKVDWLPVPAAELTNMQLMRGPLPAADPVKVDPPAADPAKVDPPAADPVKVDPPAADPVKVDPPAADPATTPDASANTPGHS